MKKVSDTDPAGQKSTDPHPWLTDKQKKTLKKQTESEKREGQKRNETNCFYCMKTTQYTEMLYKNKDENLTQFCFFLITFLWVAKHISDT